MLINAAVVFTVRLTLRFRQGTSSLEIPQTKLWQMAFLGRASSPARHLRFTVHTRTLAQKIRSCRGVEI